ncbi:MAG TPA: RNA polymerase sigma factor [Actinomycetota bacterium]|nr:RNA polymerase sigma factor [Actinomycetota bacterium]
MREPEPGTVVRAQAGDLRAFETLVRECQADVWRFAYHLTRSRAAADDVTQEAFLHAFRALRSYRGGESKFSSWLLRIVRNCATDLYRRTRKEDLRAEPLDAAERSPAGESAEDRIRIEAALQRLPPELREPFVMIEVLGFDYRETSAILQVKQGTLKSRMHRARARLVAALSSEEVADEA